MKNPILKLNDCEKALALKYPNCFTQLAANYVAANLLTTSHMGINSTNDCSDAFRHSLFNALNAFFCGEAIAQEFGEAHECVTSSQKAKTMDLHNNNQGYLIIQNNSDISTLMSGDVNYYHHQGIALLIDEICNSLTIGNMLVFSNPIGEDPDNDPVNLLIPSNNCECL